MEVKLTILHNYFCMRNFFTDLLKPFYYTLLNTAPSCQDIPIYPLPTTSMKFFDYNSVQELGIIEQINLERFFVAAQQ